jgi:hypothetical protein
MPIWRVELYANQERTAPTKIGHIRAANETEASHAVVGQMGSSQHADIILTIIPTGDDLPEGEVVWLR